MPITTDKSGAIVATGRDSVNTVQLIAARRGLKLEIETGMSLTGQSLVQACIKHGWVTPGTRSKKKAYAQLNDRCVGLGLTSVELAK